MIKKYLHIILWFIVFFYGIIELIDFYPIPIIRGLVPLIVIILFLNIIRKKRLIIPHISIFLFFTFTCIISAIINNINLSNFIKFFNFFLIPYLYLIVIINENNLKLLKLIKKLILFLFFLQIPASIIKYILVGQSEEYIGTISVREGSLSTIIPMIAISYLFSQYLYRRNKINILFIVLFVLFGLIGGKRAIVFFVPSLIIFQYLVHNLFMKINFKYTLRNAVFALIIGSLLVYIMVRLNPSLTPEDKIGGSFDINYVLEYTEKYTAMDNPLSSGKSKYKLRRIEGFLYFANYLYSQKPITFLFGEGAGKLITGGKNESRPMVYYYNVRYGGRMGLIYLYLQIGLVGSILFLIMIIKMLNFVLKNRQDNYYFLAFVGFWFTIMLDISLYSKVSIVFFPIIGILFTSFAFLYRAVKFKDKIFVEIE